MNATVGGGGAGAEIPGGKLVEKTMMVVVDSEGRLTLPDSARQALNIEGAVLLELQAADGALALRPVDSIPEEDAWLYTPEHLARIERAHQDAREGRVLELTVEDLQKLIDE